MKEKEWETKKGFQGKLIQKHGGWEKAKMSEENEGKNRIGGLENRGW